jgi:glycerol uptake facilitator-like aquaporin
VEVPIMFGRRKVASLVAEFLGTAVLTLLIFSVQRSQLGLQYFVALAAGIAVAAMTFAFGEVSGAQFNPALTIGLWASRKITTIKALGYIVVQVAGAYAAFGIYRYYSGTHLSDVGGHATWKIFTAEAVGTFILAMGYASTLYKSYSQSSKAIFYGLAYTVGILIASSAAIGILNPAVAAGLKALVWGTYIAGPVVGGLVGIFLYTVLFADSGVEGVLALETVTVVEATASSPRSTTKKTTVKKTTAKRKTTRKRA